MQTSDITRQWTQGNYGKFNRGVDKSRNPVFYFVYDNYFNSYGIWIMLNYIYLADGIYS